MPVGCFPGELKNHVRLALSAFWDCSRRTNFNLDLADLLHNVFGGCTSQLQESLLGAC